MGGAGLDQAKKILAFYIGGMGDYYRQLLEGFGFGDACAEIAGLYRDRATRRQAAGAVTQEMVDALTITGEPQECIARLRAAKDAGVDLPIVCLPPQAPWPVQEMFLRALAPNQ